MADQHRTYSPPTLVYHGTVSELTQSQHLIVGGQVVRFAAAFANSLGAPIVVPGPGDVINPPVHGHGPSSGTITEIVNSGGNGPGAHGGSPGGGATGGAGKTLPFTGLAVIGVASVGAALASAGVALKRIVRKPPST